MQISQYKADNKYYNINFKFDRDIVDFIKSLSGRKFIADTKSWILLKTQDNLSLLYARYKEIIDIDETIKAEFFEILKQESLKDYIPSDTLEFDYKIPKGIETYRHQIMTFNTMIKMKRYAVFNDMGTGKTINGGMAVDYLYKKGKIKKVLIVSPVNVMRLAWMDTIRKYFKDLSVSMLYGNSNERHDIYMKYPVLIHLINWDYLEFFNNHAFIYDCVILDESAQVRNIKTQRFKILNKFLPVKYTFILSGLPAPNSPFEYWSQFKLLDGGELLGDNYFSFRARYGYKSGYMGKVWNISQTGIKKIEEMVKSKSIRFTIDQCVDLPANIEATRSIKLENYQYNHYQDMLNNLFIQMQAGEIEASNAAVKTIKLQQIAGGWIYDEEHNICQVFDKKNGKLEEIKTILLEEFKGKQVLIFSYFKPHIKGLYDFITKLGIKCVLVYGENTPAQTDDAIKKFRSGEVSVLIGNPASMGHGITLTETHVVVWFTPIWNLEIFEQARQRVHRIGLKHKTYEIFLQAEDTIEEDIYMALKEKKSLAMVILDSIKNKSKVKK